MQISILNLSGYILKVIWRIILPVAPFYGLLMDIHKPISYAYCSLGLVVPLRFKKIVSNEIKNKKLKWNYIANPFNKDAFLNK